MPLVIVSRGTIYYPLISSPLILAAVIGACSCSIAMKAHN